MAAACRLTARRWRRFPGRTEDRPNVVLNVAFGESTMAVDTHVFRLGNRTGLAPGKTVRVVEDGAGPRCRGHPATGASLLILHGRYVCKARTPSAGAAPPPRGADIRRNPAARHQAAAQGEADALP